MLPIFISSTLIFFLILSYLIYDLRMKFQNNNKKIKLFLFNNRLNKIYTFENISENILFDILEAFKDFHGSYEQVHAILPLLSDIRKHGDKLMSQRKFYHTIFFPDSEQRLANKIRRLQQVEVFIKSLSKNSQSNILTSILRKPGSYENI